MGLAALGGGAWLVLSRFGLRIVIARDVPVQLRGELPVVVALQQSFDVALDHEIAANARLGPVPITIDETIDVHLHETLELPISTVVAVDQQIPISMPITIDTVLTERELDLSQLEIPLDTHVWIDDIIRLDLTIPIDTTATTLMGVRVPVKMDVPVHVDAPIRQRVRVRDTIRIGSIKLRVPLRLTLPIEATLPLAQELHVTGTVNVPLNQHLRIPLRQKLLPSLPDRLPLTVKLEGKLPATLNTQLQAKVAVQGPLQAQVGALHLDASSLSIERRRSD